MQIWKFIFLEAIIELFETQTIDKCLDLKPDPGTKEQLVLSERFIFVQI